MLLVHIRYPRTQDSGLMETFFLELDDWNIAPTPVIYTGSGWKAVPSDIEKGQGTQEMWCGH
jgi:hypothetical protein